MQRPRWFQALLTRKSRRRRKTAMTGQTYDVTANWADGIATVRFGSETFTVSSPALVDQDRSEFDFVVYGLMALSMTYGASFRIAAPITPAMQAAYRELRYCFEIWRLPQLYPPRIVFTEDAPELPPHPDGRVALCLSGGIDSTAAAIHGCARGKITDGLLIAGADYPSSESPGYIELRARVLKTSDALEIPLLEVETDLRKFKYEWELLHGLNLGMCLSFLRPILAGGAIGLDNTLAQDLVRHPWGNTAALAQAMGHPGFPIASLGADLDRVQKTALIGSFTGSDLLSNLAVCWEDTAQGGNCGVCTKCVQTRLNFVCAGLPEEAAFPTKVPLEDLIGTLPEPKKLQSLRGTFLRTSEFTRYLPDGPLRDRLLPYQARLSERIYGPDPD